MIVNGKHYCTIWLDENNAKSVCIIDQTKLPFEFVIKNITSFKQMADAIYSMEVRGAGLIGAAGAFAVYLATIEAPLNNQFDAFISDAACTIKATRPTAINLEWAVDRMMKKIKTTSDYFEKQEIALTEAQQIADEDSEYGRKIGQNGLTLIEAKSKQKNSETVNILTHCNAGWLALVDYGTALAPIYAAYEKGIKVHVWVDETRPRNQGASLTAWELAAAGVPHTVIANNAGGLLMADKRGIFVAIAN